MTDSKSAPAATSTKASHGTGHATHHAAAHRHQAAHPSNAFHKHVAHAAHRASHSNPTAAASPEVTEALKTAMDKEGVPTTWEPGLHFIMERESTGKVNATNGVDTARGLFQLTKASYHLNPHGAASFGNAVEEAQGGIRYIAQRYQTADNAVGFWKKHGWY
ncbi:hypothetical protein [Acidisphaera sp. L21]|jgi:hypothetical protein|uniref:aggregation-promoting factor C-terminal-like domain-containing protein n=1 Tax=Acidisphaera sp. L21 TaxID=1641851 RepID=UPI001C209E30|nr:hypothetical protein [Acidisphaera sp. L21]